MAQAIDEEEFDIENYMENAQPFLRKALKNPLSVSHRLDKIAQTIVNRSWEDPTYPAIGAKMCMLIMEKEKKEEANVNIPLEKFSYGVMAAINETLDQNLRKERNEDGCFLIEEWVRFVQFTEILYSLMRRKTGCAITGLIGYLVKCCEQLATKDSVSSPEEFILLCKIIGKHGQDMEMRHNHLLEKWTQQLNRLALEDHIPCTEVTPSIRRALLFAVEMSMLKWNVPQDIYDHYSDFFEEGVVNVPTEPV